MDDIFWKAGYFFIIIIWFCIQVYYGKQSAVNKVKEKVRPGFESFLVGLHFISMTIPLLVVLTPFLESFAIPLPEPVRFVFLIIFSLNIWLFVVAHRDLGTNWSAILEIREGHRLVRTGIYRHIRHPIYTHFWIWVIAQGIVLANALVLVFGIIAWGILYFFRVPKEEEMLIAEFGDEYRNYMKVTGRVIPKF